MCVFISVLLINVHVYLCEHSLYVGAHEDHKKASDSLELE